MAKDKRVVKAREDVEKARCQYCGRTFKSPRGRTTHERSCKEKERLDGAAQSGAGTSEESSQSSIPSASEEAVDVEVELDIPSPDDKKGGLKVDFRMPDASLLSDPSHEIKQLISDMELERKRWEDERKKFLKQTESLPIDEGAHTPDKIRELDVKKTPSPEEGLLTEMKVAAELDYLKDELQTKINIETMKELLESVPETARQLNDLEQNVVALTNVLGEFSARTLDELKAFRKKLDMKADEGDLKSVRETIRRLDGKLEGVVEEVGFEEALDISKVPPRILELVYQTTLDDVAATLHRTLGEMETEKIISQAMEDVRVRTSGSELFRYQYSRFKVQGLASSIQNGLISARQVQMTYEEILNRLREHMPRHHAKNFRAMIKVKSQEFAVERSTEMAGEIAAMQKEVHALKQSISDTTKHLSNEISQIASKLNEIDGKPAEAEPTDDGALEVKISNGFLGPEIPQEAQDQKGGTVGREELEKGILAVIPATGTSLTKMKNQLEYPEEVLQSGLDSLVQKGLTEKKKRGKGFVYSVKEEGELVGGGSGNE